MPKTQTQPYRIFHHTPLWIPRLDRLSEPIQAKDLGWPERYPLVAQVETTDLDGADRLTQHLDRAWWDNPEVTSIQRSRSTSVGDVIVDPKGIAWVVASLGFEQLKAGEITPEARTHFPDFPIQEPQGNISGQIAREKELLMDNQSFAPRRACGRRVPGGVYAETRLGQEGLPLEGFVHCPPKSIDLAEFGLTAVGVQLVEFQGLWHVFDVVGQEHYPYVADFVEETRHKGASRRLSKNLDFEKLSTGSRLVLIHARAILENYVAYSQPPVVSCPKEVHLGELDEMCAGLWWHDIPASDLERSLEVAHHRRIPGGVSYIAYPRPEGLMPEHKHGIFLSLPITNLAVIAGRNPQEEQQAEETFLAARMSGLPVDIEEQ